jgi:two-component system, NarL family, nitrate/nitrite sensor histidine kinase NarX
MTRPIKKIDTRVRLAGLRTILLSRWPREISGRFWQGLFLPVMGLLTLLLGLIVATILSLLLPTHAEWLQIVQLFLLTCLSIVLIFLLKRANQRLATPLAQMRNWAQRIRRGNLSARVPTPAQGELAYLARDINTLSDELKSLTLDMDSRVRAQTVRLARKTQSLDILYDVATSLNEAGKLDTQLGSFLDTFIELVDARAASVRVLTATGQTRLIASRGLDQTVIEKDVLMKPQCACGWAATKGGIRIQHGTQECTKLIGMPMLTKDCREFVVVPVQYQEHIIGVYNLFLDRPLTALGEDVHDLLISVGKHLGLAIVKARLDNDARRLAIMEERNMLGNELHDSLAQSLVSMRLQIKMLGETLHKKDIRTAQNEVRRLREAIDEAHTSLRELLANFRLKIDEGGLTQAIQTMIERFNQDTGISVFFQNECTDPSLSPAQEIHVFHIIQEALSNIRKHSQACNARILFTNPHDGHFSLLIEDDGEGLMPTQPGLPGEHIGLSVMRDRAERLHGELTIESEPGEGTRVLLIFGQRSSVSDTQAFGG